MIKKLCQFCVVAACMSLIGFASAHEMRHVCAGGSQVGVACENQPDTLMFHVGFANEPAWTTDSNGVNINISWHPDQAHNSTLTQNVDTSAGDVVKLSSVTVQYFGSEDKYSPGMKPKKSMIVYSDGNGSPVIPQNTPDKNGNIRLKFGTHNVYNAYFRPSKAGVYGFVIKGMVSHTNKLDNTVHSFDFSKGLSFICGVQGTQDTSLTNTKFGCVQDELALPSGSKNDEHE